MSNSGQKCVPVISAAAKAVNFVDNGASVSRQSLLNKETAGVNQQQAFVCAVSWAFAKECHLSQLSNLVCRRGSAECPGSFQSISNMSEEPPLAMSSGVCVAGCILHAPMRQLQDQLEHPCGLPDSQAQITPLPSSLLCKKVDTLFSLTEPWLCCGRETCFEPQDPTDPLLNECLATSGVGRPLEG